MSNETDEGVGIDAGEMVEIGGDTIALLQKIASAMGADSEGGKKVTKAEALQIGADIFRMGAELLEAAAD